MIPVSESTNVEGLKPSRNCSPFDHMPGLGAKTEHVHGPTSSSPKKRKKLSRNFWLSPILFLLSVNTVTTIISHNGEAQEEGYDQFFSNWEIYRMLIVVQEPLARPKTTLPERRQCANSRSLCLTSVDYVSSRVCLLYSNCAFLGLDWL